MNVSPVVISCSSPRGRAGSPFSVYVGAAADLLAAATPISLVFGSSVICTPAVTRAAPDVAAGYPHCFALTISVPALHDSWLNKPVAVDVLIDEPSGKHTLHATEYISTSNHDPAQPAQQQQQQQQHFLDQLPPPSMQQKLPQLQQSLFRHASYDATMQQQQLPTYVPHHMQEPQSSYAFSQPEATFPYLSPYTRQMAPTRGFSYSQQAPALQQQQLPPGMMYASGGAPVQMSPSMGPGPASYVAPSAHGSSTRSSFGADDGSGDMVPQLCRTSTLTTAATGGGNNVATGGMSGPLNGTGRVTSRPASLRILGNLDDLVHNWTAEEVQASRRLVKFHCTQRGVNIEASAETISQNEYGSASQHQQQQQQQQQPSHSRPPTSASTVLGRGESEITISCIYWREKQDYYVTSVDCLALLEKIVSCRFPVEEKNRIRRNLEGFHPETVSKGRLESEAFFKLIMSFPFPKPRNIEKDVKVFKWTILDSALRKIVQKYSTAYPQDNGAYPLSPTPPAQPANTAYRIPPLPQQQQQHSHPPSTTPQYPSLVNGPGNNINSASTMLMNSSSASSSLLASVAGSMSSQPTMPGSDHHTQIAPMGGGGPRAPPGAATAAPAGNTIPRVTAWDTADYYSH
ncbi:uncharacterized protein V1518DRAFT_259440 [Limtongia smithiae]|uniref:uncharacterized protein n=1 Tax=Limtongia smithiae TaxID=1125753 RepID=UPI0034CD2A87